MLYNFCCHTGSFLGCSPLQPVCVPSAQPSVHCVGGSPFCDCKSCENRVPQCWGPGQRHGHPAATAQEDRGHPTQPPSRKLLVSHSLQSRLEITQAQSVIYPKCYKQRPPVRELLVSQSCLWQMTSPHKTKRLRTTSHQAACWHHGQHEPTSHSCNTNPTFSFTH